MVHRAARRAAWAVPVVALAACAQLPYGETLVVVDTDVSVPRLVGALRVDVFQPDGTWTESRDFPTFDRAQWPLSFAIKTDGPTDRTVRLRLRAYPEGRHRDYLGERYQEPHPPFNPPHAAHSLGELCQSPPLLPPLTEMTLRRGTASITGPLTTADCARESLSGSVAVRVEIPEAGTYRFEVVRSVPDSRFANDTTLYLRTECPTQDTQVACNDDIAPDNTLSRLVVAHLAPGTYFLLSGGGNFWQPGDVTLRWSRADQWDHPSVLPTGPPPDPLDPGPRLVIDGVDATPGQEPRPLVTLDRLVDVTVAAGTRRTAAIVLRGECFGTMADLRGGRSCVDASGQLEPVSAATLADGTVTSATTVSGTWVGEQVVQCTVPPRPRGVGDDGTQLMDEEVCIPGGAFLLGDAGAPILTNDATELVAVVAPFLMQKYELTVGRFRQALREGFAALDASPYGNDDDLSSAHFPASEGTWNGDVHRPSIRVGMERERFPLNSVSPNTAELICRFLGGSLPTEAQWEYAAAAAGRAGEVRYPTGDRAPGCDQVAYGRWFDPTSLDRAACSEAATGPVAVDDQPWASHDVTASGVVGMAGGVAEFVAGSHRSYDDPCWRQHLLRDVRCDEADAPSLVLRGGGWSYGLEGLVASLRLYSGASETSTSAGLRCVRPGRPP